MDSLKEEEQLNKDSSLSNEQPKDSQQEVFFELDDGTKITKEEAKQGYLRQSDYTKKTTLLAEEKKNSSNPELDETIKILKDAGVVTKDDIAELTKFKEDTLNKQKLTQEETVFNDFVSEYTNLSDTHKTILKDLKKVHSDKSYDDILKLTGFVDQSIIEKSKTTINTKGASLGIPEEKEELSVNKKVSQKYGLKSVSEIDDIKSKFNL